MKEDSYQKPPGWISMLAALLMGALSLLAACTNEGNWDGPPNRTPAEMRAEMLENMQAHEYYEPLGSTRPEGALAPPGMRPAFDALPPPHPSRPPGERD